MSSDAAHVPTRTWSVFDGLPLTAVVTTSEGGVSDGPYRSLNLGLHVGDDQAAVLENRRRAACALGLTLDDLVFGNQAHGRAVVVVSADDRGRGARGLDDVIGDVDALVSTAPGVGLAAMVADCVPIAVYAPDAHAVAVVHAGWRGLVAGVIGAAVSTLVDLGASPTELRAGVGPAIPAERYEVGAEVADAVRTRFGDAAGAVLRAGAGDRSHFDLWAAAAHELSDAGIPDRQVEVMATPTGPGTPFFSDRAARPCGRFAVLAALRTRA